MQRKGTRSKNSEENEIETIENKKQETMKKALRIFGIVVLIGAFGGTLFFLYNKSKKKEDVFETKTPFVSNVIVKTVATGSVVPRFEIEIKPQVSGIIDELFLVAGDRVVKGQVVARIKIIPDMVSLNSAETRVNRAVLNNEDAKIDYDRQQKLFEKRYVQTGLSDGINIEITEGLKMEDKVKGEVIDPKKLKENAVGKG